MHRVRPGAIVKVSVLQFVPAMDHCFEPFHSDRHFTVPADLVDRRGDWRAVQLSLDRVRKVKTIVDPVVRRVIGRGDHDSARAVVQTDLAARAHHTIAVRHGERSARLARSRHLDRRDLWPRSVLRNRSRPAVQTARQCRSRLVRLMVLRARSRPVAHCCLQARTHPKDLQGRWHRWGRWGRVYRSRSRGSCRRRPPWWWCRPASRRPACQMPREEYSRSYLARRQGYSVHVDVGVDVDRTRGFYHGQEAPRPHRRDGREQDGVIGPRNRNRRAAEGLSECDEQLADCLPRGD